VEVGAAWSTSAGPIAFLEPCCLSAPSFSRPPSELSWSRRRMGLGILGIRARAGLHRRFSGLLIVASEVSVARSSRCCTGGVRAVGAPSGACCWMRWWVSGPSWPTSPRFSDLGFSALVSHIAQLTSNGRRRRGYMGAQTPLGTPAMVAGRRGADEAPGEGKSNWEREHGRAKRAK